MGARGLGARFVVYSCAKHLGLWKVGFMIQNVGWCEFLCGCVKHGGCVVSVDMFGASGAYVGMFGTYVDMCGASEAYLGHMCTCWHMYTVEYLVVLA